MRRIRLLALAFAATLIPNLAHAQMSKSNGASLYQRIGGYDAVAAVTDDFVGRLASDAKLSKFFGGLSVDSKLKLRQHVIDFVCQAAGGPCGYTGRDMKTAHKGLGITEGDWNTAVNHFLATLAKFNVKSSEKDELVNAVASVKGDIVEKM